jgi:hypothetical protein
VGEVYQCIQKRMKCSAFANSNVENRVIAGGELIVDGVPLMQFIESDLT